MDAPCRYCEDRTVGCHSSCTRYKEFKDTLGQCSAAKPTHLYKGRPWLKRLPKDRGYYKALK